MNKATYDRVSGEGEKFEPDPPVRMMKVSIEVDGEFITTEVPTTRSIVAIFDEDGHLRGLETVKGL